MNFKFALTICLNLLLMQSQFAQAAFVVNLQFDDVLNNTGVGFDDPTHGLARRDTVQSVMNYVSSQLDPSVYSTAIDYRIQNSQMDGSGFLASSGPYFFSSPNGYGNGFVYDHATTGIDPSGGFPDSIATFDFGYNWHPGTSANPGGLFDLFSVTLHEFTHSMGFLTLMNSSGVSSISGTDPGVFGVFASFLERGDGTQLFGPGGDFLGNLGDLTSDDVFFDGPNATAANGGNPIKIYAPGTFQPGSSFAHLDPMLNALMNPSFGPGVEKREWTTYDSAILQDIGWEFSGATAVPEPGSIFLMLLTLCGAAYRKRQQL